MEACRESKWVERWGERVKRKFEEQGSSIETVQNEGGKSGQNAEQCRCKESG